jgi:hypothetical protein
MTEQRKPLAPITGDLSEVLVPPPAAHSHGPVVLGHPPVLSHDMPGLHHRSNELPNGAATPEIAPLRLRLFADGSLVVDNPERPLAVYPLAHTGELEADPITLTLDGVLAKNLPLFLKSVAKEK